MRKYLLKRILLVIPTIAGALLLVYLLMQLVPGDICEVSLLAEGAASSEEALRKCREALGLTGDPLAQFANQMGRYLVLDLGDSMWTGRPIAYELELRFEMTLQLAIMTLFCAVLIALPLGIVSAVWRRTLVDYLVRSFAIAGEAIPSFWLGIMIILGMLIGTQWLFGDPWMQPITFVSIWQDPWHNLSQLILPAIATGYRASATLTRMTRSAMLEVLREDYIRTARAKGMSESIIRLRHALKNAMLPVVTLIGIEFAFLMGGLVVTEQVFNLNGIGQLFVHAVEVKDLNMVQAIVLVTVLVFVFINLVVDIFYAWLDPRIRYS